MSQAVMNRFSLLIFLVSLPCTLLFGDAVPHAEPGSKSGDLPKLYLLRPYSCRPDSTEEASRPFKPESPIHFALVTRNEDGKTELSRPGVPGIQCQPVVFKRHPQTSDYEFAGPLCAEKRVRERRSDEGPETNSERSQEDTLRTYLSSGACAMPDTHKWYSQIWLEDEKKYLKISVPCVKEWDPFFKPQACVENDENSMSEIFDLYRMDAMMQGIDRWESKERWRKWKGLQEGPANLDIGEKGWSIS